MKKIVLFQLFFLVSGLCAWAQSDSTRSWTLSGYAEAYYVYDFNEPTNNTRPGFIYSHNRHHEFNLNIGFIKLAYDDQRVRANLALMVGTYSNANLAAEPGVFKNIYEANVGVKLTRKKNLWLDAGIFASHIGFESAVGKDCWNLTRSQSADNSPYYESGAKLSYTSDNGQWFFSGLVLNGWQQIQRADGNNSLALGTQITFKPTAKITLNSSSFIGSRPDDTNRKRYFHNLFGIFQITKKFGLTAGLDYGIEQEEENSSAYDHWYTPTVILRYAFSDQWAIAGRFENYRDKNGVIIATDTPKGFNTQGYSLNLDFSPVPNAVIRLEGRLLDSQDAIFPKGDELKNTNAFISTAIGISF